MRIYFFTKGDKNVPSSRYRAYYIAEELENLGYQTKTLPTNKRSVRAFFEYTKVLLSLRSNDIIYIQRAIYNKYFTLALFLAYILGKRYVFDIDDAVYEHSRLKTILFVKYAIFVTCGSEKILNWTKQYNKKSYILHNGIPLSIYSKRVEEPTGIPVIGWIGSLPQLFMRSAIPALHLLVSQGEKFHLKVIGAMGNQEIRDLLNGIPNLTIIDSLNWADPSDAVKEIKTFTIGIMPLRQDPWDEVKYFKALEYMACCVPVIASNGETVRNILEKNKCGFIAENSNDWIKYMTSLIKNKNLREEMGKNGRLAVENSFSIKQKAKELLNLLKENFIFY